MLRATIGGFLLMSALFASPALAEKPKPGSPTEKIDGKSDRALTGFVEKIEAKDENKGTVVMRTSGPKYRLVVNENTKILTAKGDPLNLGLKSPLLAKAEIRVTFFDKEPKGKKVKEDIHVCNTIQLVEKTIKKPAD
jgi:hypothetical protein